MLTKEDFNKIEKSNSDAKRTESAVYSTVDGKTNFHPLHTIKIGVSTIGDILKSLDDKDALQEGKIQVFKEAILNMSKEIEEIKIILAKYGME